MFSAGNFQRNGYGDREEWNGERGKAERKHGRGRDRETREGASGGAIGGKGRGWRETNEGKVKKRKKGKKYRARFIKGVSWAADSVRIFTEYPTTYGRKMPYLVSTNLSLLKSPKLPPPPNLTHRFQTTC